MPVVQSDVQMFLVRMLCEAGFCDDFGARAVARGSLRGGGGRLNWLGLGCRGGEGCAQVQVEGREGCCLW